MSSNSLVPATFPLPAPTDGTVDVLIIAGEHSGDEHAGRMVEAARKHNPLLKIAALGGQNLKNAGAELICDMMPYAIVGIFEVLKHYGPLKQLRDEIINWILLYKPRAVCFVDYPGLNLRLAKKLAENGASRKGGGDIRLLYYISPQVWAWKANRRFDMAKLLDTLGVIFPFEVETFADTSLETKFVGHPFLSESYSLPIHYDPNAPVLLLPGSRAGAISRIAPIMFESFRKLVARKPEIVANCIYASDTLKKLLEDILGNYGDLKDKVSLVPNSAATNACCTLTSSGTMSLNCALAGIPGAIVYRIHPVTYFYGKRIVKIPFIGIANLLLNRAYYPEYIQENAKADVLAEELIDCMENPLRVEEAQELSAALRDLLDKPSSGGAGKWLNDNINF